MFGIFEGYRRLISVRFSFYFSIRKMGSGGFVPFVRSVKTCIMPTTITAKPDA